MQGIILLVVSIVKKFEQLDPKFYNAYQVSYL